MNTGAKVFLGAAALGLLYSFTRPAKVKLKYRATQGSENGLTGLVEWVLELPGKTYNGVRDASELGAFEILTGDYHFTITNTVAQQGYPVNFSLTTTTTVPPKVLISVGMLPVLDFVGAGWVEESEKASVSGAKEYPNAEISLREAVTKYGWDVEKVSDTDFDIYNRNQKKIIAVQAKGDKYAFFNSAGEKLVTGRGQIQLSMENLATKYFYAQRVI